MDDDDRRAEIAELRRRVFGPGADPSDAAARERLRELEREGRDRAGRDPRGAEVVDPAEAAAADPDRTSRITSRIRPARRIRPRLAVVWAASLLVAALASAGTTAWWLGDERGTVAVLALTPPPVPDNATYLSVDTGSIAPGSLFAAFRGISVARIPVPDATTGVEETCLVAGPAEQDGSVAGLPGCATGTVPARTALVVTADQPQELRDAFPLGTTLSFELEEGGETVRVRTVGG
ncbi:hypothetical protein [Clavibacter michiganensis]|uniref:hypothetical protein n=1 Tax=Clavibacter michiganensis TaxID=28447 RepID=UPI0005BB9D58|nr:hypothetical protein [Clavibacter michiganensis]